MINQIQSISKFKELVPIKSSRFQYFLISLFIKRIKNLMIKLRVFTKIDHLKGIVICSRIHQKEVVKLCKYN